MSLEQLAAAGSRLRQACGAAHAGAQVECFSDELPAKTWLLTFRAAVAERLQLSQLQEQHSSSDEAPEGSSPQPAAAAAAAAAAGAASATAGQVAAIATIVATIAVLPIAVVQPLPIGASSASRLGIGTDQR
jgi:hypothetical protein